MESTAVRDIPEIVIFVTEKLKRCKETKQHMINQHRKLDYMCQKCDFVTKDSKALKKRNSTLEISTLNKGLKSVIIVAENSKALEKGNSTLERSITIKSDSSKETNST